MKNEIPLTKRQRQIADFVTAYTSEHRCAPSLREIAAHLGLKSAATVHRHIQLLQQKGIIQHHPKRRRGLLLADKTEEGLVELPLLGIICAGYPLELSSHPQKLSVARSLVPDPDHCYILQAQGDTMLDVAITDGDLLVVHARRWADEGELVIGVLNTGETIVKRFFWDNGQVSLHGLTPTNSDLTLSPEALSIHGIVTAVIRVL